mgnify:CR=1 FL=1
MSSLLHIKRYPPASDKSLRPWNAADELILEQLSEEEEGRLRNCLVIHDLFGYLSCQLNRFQAQSIITFDSQRMSLNKNIESNELSSPIQHTVLEQWSSTKTVALKIPKSIDLFRLYLSRLVEVLDEDGVVYCGFMTRNFTPAWIKLTEEYFEEVGQSKAKKKARLMILKRPVVKETKLIQQFVDDEGMEWQQYLGVFSAGRLDPASRFLMEEMEIPMGEMTVLDLGCGNGVLGKFIAKQNPQASLILVDDSELAIASAKLNVEGNHQFYCSADLSPIQEKSVDLIVCNPPFHFEYELNTDVAFRMFKEANGILKDGGEFWVVANNNLPYKPELLKHFQKVEIVSKNRKFFIYRCSA